MRGILDDNEVASRAVIAFPIPRRQANGGADNSVCLHNCSDIYATLCSRAFRFASGIEVQIRRVASSGKNAVLRHFDREEWLIMNFNAASEENTRHADQFLRPARTVAEQRLDTR